MTGSASHSAGIAIFQRVYLEPLKLDALPVVNLFVLLLRGP